MLKIGITGGIGSGKTTVCKIFEMLGVPVYYADEESKKILVTDKNVKAAILKTFGKDILNDENNIDRQKLATLVFNDKQKLESLNSIVHPAVNEHFKNWLKKYSFQKYILKEAAILFESGAYKAVDKVIAVVAPVELKIDHAMKRDKITREQVLQRIANQAKDSYIIKHSQFVIHNDEEQLLIPQVIAVHKQLMQL